MMVHLQAGFSPWDLDGKAVCLRGVTQPNPATKGETKHGQTVTWPSLWVDPEQKKVPCP